MAAATLREFLLELRNAEPLPRPQREEWTALITRISTPSRVSEVDEDTYDYFLNVLPPKWMGYGGFAFAEGAEALRIFWCTRGCYYVRLLTWQETQTFCRLADIPEPW